MLRKDVQIGLSIGGVLLAVLIVYAVVVSSSKKHQKAIALDRGVSVAACEPRSLHRRKRHPASQSRG